MSHHDYVSTSVIEEEARASISQGGDGVNIGKSSPPAATQKGQREEKKKEKKKKGSLGTEGFASPVPEKRGSQVKGGKAEPPPTPTRRRRPLDRGRRNSPRGNTWPPKLSSRRKRLSRLDGRWWEKKRGGPMTRAETQINETVSQKRVPIKGGGSRKPIASSQPPPKVNSSPTPTSSSEGKRRKKSAANCGCGDHLRSR